jgi:hypothetical protein
MTGGLKKGDSSNGTCQAKVLTVGELANALRVKTSWVYVHADELGALRIGKYLRFLLPDVIELLKTKRHNGAPVKLPAQRPTLTNLESVDSDG